MQKHIFPPKPPNSKTGFHLIHITEFYIPIAKCSFHGKKMCNPGFSAKDMDSFLMTFRLFNTDEFNILFGFMYISICLVLKKKLIWEYTIRKGIQKKRNTNKTRDLWPSGNNKIKKLI